MFRASWASLTSVDGEQLVDALGNRISKAMGCYSSPAFQFQLLSKNILPLPAKESFRADDGKSLVFKDSRSFAGPG